MFEKFLPLLNNYNLQKEKKIAIAVSGGVDSLSLTLVANIWAKEHGIKVVAITVDHSLRKNSIKEVEYVSKLLKSKNIEHHILTWEGVKPKGNIEAIAREKRYELLTEFCKKHRIKSLLVAHHLQDQAETFFIRLFRGSGIDGLASMREYVEYNGIRILRPFLQVRKEDLKQYLKKKKIKWIEDESNVDEKFQRNKIRKFLDSFENKKDILTRINFAIKEIASARDLIEDKIKKIGKNILTFDEKGFYIIDLTKFKKLEKSLGLRILAKVSMRVSGAGYKPRLKKLERIYLKLLNNFKKETFYGCVLQKIRNDCIIYREYAAIKKDVRLKFKKEVIWDKRFKITLKKDIKDLVVTHIKKGQFGGYLNNLKKDNLSRYKKLKDLKGLEKEIFYTLPIIKIGTKIISNYTKFGIKIKFI